MWALKCARPHADIGGMERERVQRAALIMGVLASMSRPRLDSRAALAEAAQGSEDRRLELLEIARKARERKGL